MKSDTLSIRGEKKADEKVKREDYIYQEHRYGAFGRTVTLPVGLDTNKAEASFENGVLTLTIPKSEEVKPKQIKIKARGAIEGKKEERKGNKSSELRPLSHHGLSFLVAPQASAKISKNLFRIRAVAPQIVLPS